MFTDQHRYEVLLNIVCDEINVHEIHIKSPQLPNVAVIYNKDSNSLRVEANGNIVDAPKTMEIILKAFF